MLGGIKHAPIAFCSPGTPRSPGTRSRGTAVIAHRPFQVIEPVGKNPVLYALSRFSVFQDIAVQLRYGLRVNNARFDYALLELHISIAEIKVNLIPAVAGRPGFGDNLAFVGGNAGAEQEIAEGAADVILRRPLLMAVQQLA